MASYSTASSRTLDFYHGWRSLADGQSLPFLLLVLGTASNTLYAHAPLAAFAALSGASLSRRRAIAIALAIWFVNQAIGFGLQDYPLSATAFTWGALMGMGTLLVVAFASIRPGFSQSSWTGHFVWVAIACISGFVLYQGLMMLVSPMLADGHLMNWDVVAKLFRKQVVWGGALALGHGVLLWRHLSSLRWAQD